MSVLLVVLMTLLVVGHNCDKAEDIDKFALICKVEDDARRAFDAFDHLGNEEEKDALFWKLLKARRERVALSKIFGDLKCMDGEEVDDGQVFHQLCSDEMTLKSYANIQDEFLRSKIDKMLRSAGWRRKKFGDQLWFETRKTMICSASSSDTNHPKYVNFSMRLKEKFQELCKEEIFYDYVQRKVADASKGIKLELTQMPVKEAMNQFEETHEAREQFCEGSIEICCDKRLVVEGKAEATIRATEILLELVEGSASLLRSMYKQERRNNHWDARFKRACAIEHQTDLAYSSLPVRVNILSDLHQQAVEVRTSIGKGLDKKSCPDEHSTPQSGPNPIQLDNKIDATCDIVKAKVMCRVLNNANDFEQFKYNGASFEQLRSAWCVMAKMNIGPNRSRCSAQIGAILTNEALAEAQVSIELLELGDESRRLELLKGDTLNVAREEYRALDWIKQLNEKELKEQTSEINKEKSQQSVKLISDRLAKLWNQTVY